jgi:hypothetical protein
MILVMALRKQFLRYIASKPIKAVWSAALLDQLAIEQDLFILIVINRTNPGNVCNLAEIGAVLNLNDLLDASDSEFVLEF